MGGSFDNEAIMVAFHCVVVAGDEIKHKVKNRLITEPLRYESSLS